ncbi:MAG: MmgE/PrpD family protein, partial [Dehalococcoidia bacterium]|nr:MmgE/PrpD family protein [Dehalococcoidia bacterium]
MGKAETVVERLASFAVEARFEDLPSDVVEESKRVLLDSVGCAAAGLGTRKGQIGIRFAREFDEPSKSTIIGCGQRASLFGAAFANGELMNALDYEAVLSPGHVQPSFFVPAHLAIAESQRSSGRELILATALALEISTRIGAALPHYRDVIGEKVGTSAVYGFDCAVFGGTVGAAKILQLGRTAMANALGIAAWVAPLPTGGKLVRTYGMPTVKYALAGWLCQSVLTAALLAQMGHSGDTSVFEGEYGFWRFYGSDRWDPRRLLDKLGSDWRMRSIRYKCYPCCGGLQTALDCFTSVVAENSLVADEIESIEAYLEGFCDEPMFRNDTMRTEADAQFNIGYLFAVAVSRIPVGPAWYEPSLMKNPEVLAFMKKVKFSVHPDYTAAIQEDPTSTLSKVVVKARGRVYSDERRHHKGSPALENTRLSNADLIAKFRANTCGVLTGDRADASIKGLLNLENVCLLYTSP